MLINFKEIPNANIGSGLQDTFELFARDFLQELGLTIEHHPDRGSDGGKDIIALEEREGVVGKTCIRWLVSCKHNAHSGEAVGNSSEIDIHSRLLQHKCEGFIGFYSTLPSSALNNKLKEQGFPYTIYDRERIEQLLVETEKREKLILRYFPKSFEEYKRLNNLNKKEKEKTVKNINSKINALTEEDLLTASKNAIIILELERIKEKYYKSDWEEKEKVLEELYRFSNHSNPRVAIDIVSFLSNVANQTRGGMPSDTASTIFSLILHFCPPSYLLDENKKTNEIVNTCINIGFALVYDATIKINNLVIAEYGLSVLKYVYKHTKENKKSVLTPKVLETYAEIERNLERPERTDLENAKKLVKIFKADLDTSDLSFPRLPDDLYLIVEESDKSE